MITKILRYDLFKTPVNKGRIYYVTDNRCLYKDFSSDITGRKRLPALVLNTDYERLHKVRPTNGVNYYVIENNCLWCYDTKWVLKDGQTSKYNTYAYTSNNGVSPVVSNDPFITSATTGDRIIDNNGLLGDGSIVVRDNNRIMRAHVNVDYAKRNIAFLSYLDNGFSFYPYGIASDTDSRTRIGSLHLGVDTNIDNSAPTMMPTFHTGHAKYYGTFDIEGDLRVAPKLPLPVTLTSLPEGDGIVTVHLQTTTTQMGNKMAAESEVDTYQILYDITIEVLSDTAATVVVSSYTNENGDLIGDPKDLTTYSYASSIQYDAIRNVVSDSEVTYTYVTKIPEIEDDQPFTITLKAPQSGNYSGYSIPVTFSHTLYNDTNDEEVYANMQYKKFISIESLMQQVTELSDKVDELTAKLSMLDNSK